MYDTQQLASLVAYRPVDFITDFSVRSCVSIYEVDEAG